MEIESVNPTPNLMPLFLLEYQLLLTHREDALTLFGGMTEEDDRADAGSVDILGRFNIVGEGRGFCICRAPTAKELADWLLNWISMATVIATPVVEDDTARAILKFEADTFTPRPVPSDQWAVTEDESLYAISYDFGEHQEAGYSCFANMTVEQDMEDPGKNRLLGRWHDLATGTGLAICASSSSVDLQEWASRWMHLCKCKIRPVITDADLRLLLTAKPDFEQKHQRLLDKMKRLAKPLRGWW